MKCVATQERTVRFAVGEAGSCSALPKPVLKRRARVARHLLEDCRLCERRCGVNRLAGEAAPCGLAGDTYVFNQYLSLTEELEVIPALRVYFGGCNFRCRFCDTAPACFEAALGRKVNVEADAAEYAEVVKRGARSISILGGEPTLHPHTLLELAAAAPEPLPLVVNTNLYMTPVVLDLLEGVVTRYLADFKFGNDECAHRLAGVHRYQEVVRRNVRRIAETTPLIVRHLLMPGHLECCFRPVAGWLAENLPGVRFQLYTGYVPCWRAARDPRLGRLNLRGEVRAAIDHLQTLNLDWKAGADEARRSEFTAAGQQPASMSITIGVDGRMYCHDITPDLLTLLAKLCRTDPQIAARADEVRRIARHALPLASEQGI